MRPIPQPESTFAGKLQCWRRRVKKTQQEAASFLQVPYKTYVNWEQALREPAPWQQKMVLDATRKK